MQNRIALISMAVFSMLVLLSFDIQLAYAQTVATISVFQSSNVNDDLCIDTIKIGSIFYILCRNTAGSSASVRAMSGNSTVASFALASGTPNTNSGIYTEGTNAIIVEGNPAIVKKLTLSGSSLTVGSSVSLTGCNGTTQHQLSSFLVVLCLEGTVKIVNLNTMVVTDTYNGVNGSHGGNDCTSENRLVLLNLSKGIVMCDNTEAFLFTVSGSVITFTDSKTGLDSSVSKDVFISGNAVWSVDRGSGATEVASVDTSTMTFTSEFVQLPSNSGGVSLLPLSGRMLILDAIDDSIYVYDISAEQPSVALGQLSLGQDVLGGNRLRSLDSSTFTVALSITDAGRWLEITNFTVDNIPVGEVPAGDPTNTGGVDCTLPENVNLLICRLLLDDPDATGGVLLPRVGVLITTNLTNTLCALLPIDCDANPDIKTNGIGYIFTIVLFALMVSIFFVASNGQLNKIPTFIWMMSGIALLGGLVAVEFLDATLLVIGVIVMVALAAMQIRNSITSGLDFASGDFK